MATDFGIWWISGVRTEEKDTKIKCEVAYGDGDGVWNMPHSGTPYDDNGMVFYFFFEFG